MSQLLIQIISGVVVAIVSFGFGYLLFRSQTNEQIRLEVYRRRLNAFDEILRYLDDVDHFVHRLSAQNFTKGEKDEFTLRGLKMNMYLLPYVTRDISNLFEFLVMSIWDMPDSLSKIEKADYEIHALISEDIGSHLPNSLTETWKAIRKRSKAQDPLLQAQFDAEAKIETSKF